MADTDNNMMRRYRVSSWLYTTLGGTAEIGLSEDQAQTFPAQPWDRRLCRIETGRDE
jgi:hypothetical protein